MASRVRVPAGDLTVWGAMLNLRGARVASNDDPHAIRVRWPSHWGPVSLSQPVPATVPRSARIRGGNARASFFVRTVFCDRSRVAKRVRRHIQRDNGFRDVEHQVLATFTLTTSPGRKRHWRFPMRGARSQARNGHGLRCGQTSEGFSGQPTSIRYLPPGATAGIKGLACP